MEPVEYQILLSRYGTQPIPYEKLLNTHEWNEKRERILERDQNSCTNCHRQKTKVFTLQQVQTITKAYGKFTEWSRVGSDYKLPGPVEEGHYWFFSMQKFHTSRAAYWDCKYIKHKAGEVVFVFIKAPKRYSLHIHHSKYVVNIPPWEYPDSELKTLCNWCHLELHETQKIKCYKIVDGQLEPTSLTPCKKCSGVGILHQYLHVEDGLCFRCFGMKFEELISHTTIAR